MGYIDPKFVDGAAAVVESFTCAICFNLFEKPRTACSKGHTFCAECLTAARARTPDNCPTCRDGDGNYYIKARLHFSSPFRDGNLSGDPAICTIYVHTLTGKKWSMKVRPGDTVLALKQKIRDSKNIPVAQQRLIFRGQQLADGSRLYDLKIFDGATVHVVLRPRVAN